MTKTAKKQTSEKMEFQAEVSRLLDIVANSLYSEKDVFLRELISNASDACDKLRYESLTQKDLIEDGHQFGITLELDQTNNALIISDNGIGMNREDLIDHLGTIAKSGTAAFIEQMKNSKEAGDANLIGQFGVGFYSAFMVADKVEVLSRKAGQTEAFRWTSDGFSGYEIQADEKQSVGTQITLYLKKDAETFLQPIEIHRVVGKYSDHIEFPITLIDGDKQEVINQGSALWTRPKNEITDEQYQQFYQHTSGAFDIPQQTIHWTAEGVIEYTGLLYIPGMRPFDLFDPKRKHGVKLYVKKIFITDQCEGLVPSWLRFLRGIIDSQDLPLNISREMLQSNPVVKKIQKGIITKALSEIKKLKKDEQQFDAFWNNFGSVLKEGLYEAGDQREKILDVAVFHSTGSDEPITLKTYLDQMKEGQDSIYYLTGEDLEAMKKSPQLEAFLDKGIDVLLLNDTIDEFWVPVVGTYQEKTFKSITKDAVNLDEIQTEKKDDTAKDEKDETKSSYLDPLIEKIKTVLTDQVKDVRVSGRLKTSAVCLVADGADADLRMEQLLHTHQGYQNQAQRILEINPAHPLIAKMQNQLDNDSFVENLSWLLLDQARIAEGQPPVDPIEFAKRMNSALLD